MKKTLLILALLAVAGAGVYLWTGGKEKAGAVGQKVGRDQALGVPQRATPVSGGRKGVVWESGQSSAS
jgi:hypothetical protein